ncbi:guanitoxin biosynthesis heme-dependent pre-guanitoxin N-hydroxylase GntA [Erythrobacter sp. R86502]|uniref:guanitoxin biosynthesis heme-dependent pre-guanitoxin N-hydroxylase GntA n=1 Tax=Erythrobacter sp. R86502 TaxID=3093846 RepID=UPI0036D30123
MRTFFPSLASPIDIDEEQLQASLHDHIADRAFPCVGAKSAMNSGMLEIVTAWSLTSAWDDVAIHQALLNWSKRYENDNEGLRSLAVVFSEPGDLDEAGFEKAIWERIQSLTDKDDWRGQSYQEGVSSDPDDPHFSLSFGGKAYFVVGMHPHASRAARRTKYPAMIFNLHDQFVRLREEQRYEKLRSAILTRDEKLDGSINPMLARHGDVSEARQYSGRAVANDWECPFVDPRKQ